MSLFSFWKNWGLVSRLMLAVGIAVVVGGSVQTFLFIAEGAAENSARLRRDLDETLNFVAPLIADQALVGEYAAIDQLVKKQVTKGELDRIEWADKDGRKLVAQDQPDELVAPAWFTSAASIEIPEQTVEVTSGGVGYGKLYARMTPIKAHNRLWRQFVKQLQIVVATLFLMLQFIWLIFRGNLGTLRMLAESANRFSQGDRSVRIAPDGAPEVRLAAEAFNNMANNTESLLASLGTSEAKNRLLATIVEQSSEAIWTRDLSGSVTTWNDGAMAMLGYSQDEAVGRKLEFEQSTPDEDGVRMKRLAAGERFSCDTKAMTKAGVQIDLQVALAPLVNEGNECIGTIAVARDVTLGKRGEEALRQARGAAEAANLAKSSFLARMSHEIRTPMNGVLGMTELLLETGLSSVQRKYAETVQSSGKNLLAIINDVLDFSKIEAGKLELEVVNIDLRKSLEDIVDLLAERAHVKGLELACRIPADLDTLVKGDSLRLGQILTNLTGNAIKFTQKGSVVIALSCDSQTESTVNIRFEVIDTGEGISAEAQLKIFEEFSQADGSTTRKHGGSGLGLAISRQLVEMMGGTIRCESVVGQGTSMIIALLLPIAKVQPAAIAGGRLFNDRQHLEQLRANAQMAPDAKDSAPLVLAVDDHPTNRLLLSRQLGILGLRVEKAASGQEALALWQAGAYALVISDCNMPEMDGYALTRAIREIEKSSQRARTPVLAWTANALESSVAMCLEAGMDDVLFKPAELVKLKVLVEKWLPAFKVDGAPLIQGDSGTAAAPAALLTAPPTAPPLAAPNITLTVPALVLATPTTARKAKKPAIDRKLLAEICAPDVDFEREFARNAYDSIAILADDLLTAVDGGNVREINRVGHRLRGLAANVGATILAGICADFEDFDATKNVRLPAWRTRFVAEVAQARLELAQIAVEK